MAINLLILHHGDIIFYFDIFIKHNFLFWHLFHTFNNNLNDEEI